MKIALLGDIALYGKFCISSQTYLSRIKEYFADAALLLQSYNYVVGNLETPFINGQKQYHAKSVHIGSETDNIEILKYLNINFVNLANNHIFDFGQDSFHLTKSILKNNRIEYFGVEDKSMFIEHDDNKICFSGYCCYSTNPLRLGKNGVNPLHYKTVTNILNKNKQCGYNTILSIHAGEEHINYPNCDHISFARKLSEITPYIYYGHHPHVLQGIEKYNNSLLAYSLGNFCFDDVYKKKGDNNPIVKQTDSNKSSVIVELEYQNNSLEAYKLIPIYAGDKRMIIGKEYIINRITEYSKALELDNDEYNRVRQNKLVVISQDKKKKRDIKYYVSRLKIKTFFIIKDIILNRVGYYLFFKRKLNND
jgi:poly-gamma-glutamate synthesis protein (capsule biosynthesis protein)